jgi:HPt (histidine-containing phosphotransfer) domain-containing protein
VGHLGTHQPQRSKPDPTVTEIPTIDSEAIDNLRELNPGDGGEFLREIIAIYIEDTPKRVADLKACLASGDIQTFTRAAHTIKGSSANVGAQLLKGIAERLELVSRKEGLGTVAPLMVDLEAEFGRVTIELLKLAR